MSSAHTTSCQGFCEASFTGSGRCPNLGGPPADSSTSGDRIVKPAASGSQSLDSQAKAKRPVPNHERKLSFTASGSQCSRRRCPQVVLEKPHALANRIGHTSHKPHSFVHGDLLASDKCGGRGTMRVNLQISITWPLSWLQWLGSNTVRVNFALRYGVDCPGEDERWSGQPAGPMG